MGGENAYRQTVPGLGLGSPPRRRGKEASIFDDGQRLGITPAWAGKSVPEGARQFVFEDHPRVGGEKELGDRFKTAELGSPPRGRGKGGLKKNLVCGIRITPAWAGKRSTGPPLTQTTVDHPRVGGEKSFMLDLKGFCVGSPPRGRGKACQI